MPARIPRPQAARRRPPLGFEQLDQRQMLTASYLDNIGLTDLAAQLGAAMPTGAGIPVSQVEHVENSLGGYKPDVTQPDFVGKSFAFQSGPSIISQHATRVGQRLYGDLNGVAPGITSVNSWELNSWSSKLLNLGTSLPPATETQRIENHSWKGTLGNAAQNLEVLQRLDYLIDTQHVIVATAMGNEGTTFVPQLLDSAYNTISVGLTNGTANHGFTSFGGGGRVKPDIVAPETTTSLATPQVAGAAALLLQVAGAAPWSTSTPGPLADANYPQTVKALLLAGATHGQFANWTHTNTQPLDSTYGAGQLNVLNSYNILTAGEQGPGAVGVSGWSYAQTAGPGSSQTYTFTVPAGVALSEMSVALTWDATVTSQSTTGFGSLKTTVANLDLALKNVTSGTASTVAASTSKVDNVEYLSLAGLSAGTYQIVVTSNQPQINYALAWRAASQATSTLLAADKSSIQPGRPVTFTATVDSGNPNGQGPQGSVTFFDGDTVLDNVLLQPGSNGTSTAVLVTSTLPEGTHTIRAAYSGEGQFASSSSGQLIELIATSQVLVSLVTNDPSSTYGDPVTFTVNIAPLGHNFGNPTGSIIYYDGQTPIGSSPVSTFQENGQATLTTNSLSAGTHSITAVYSGDSNYEPVSSRPVTVMVSQAPTSTAAAASANPGVFGQAIVITASVTSPLSDASGTVTFKQSATVLGSAPIVGTQASLTLSTLSVGNHPIVATYGGDGNNLASSSAVFTEQIAKSGTTTTVSSSANPAQLGQSVTLTASVAATSPGGGVPTGNVTFKEGTKVLGTVALVNGQASLSTSSMAMGNHSIVATYAGSANYTASASSTFVQTVTGLPATATVLTSDANPAVFGQTVLLTATVTTAAGTPGGTVTFSRGGTVLASVALVGGQATLAISSLPLGNSSLTATYSGNAALAASTSPALVETVTATDTSTTLAASASSVAAGQSLTLTATVAPVAPGGGTPTGTVTFRDGNKVLGTVPLVNGQATLTISSLAPGTHSLSATYGGGTGYRSSKSAILTQAVSAAIGSQALGLA